MGIRHLGLAMAVTLALCGQLGTALPAVAGPGPGPGHRPSPPAQPRFWYVNGVRGSDKNSCETAGVPCKTIGRGNCRGRLASLGHNLSSDGSCGFHGAGDLDHADPRLGPLLDNGGPTATMPLLPGSPAIDAGNPAGCTDGHGHLLGTDQRGEPRPDSDDTGGCDMGAYELQGD